MWVLAAKEQKKLSRAAKAAKFDKAGYMVCAEAKLTKPHVQHVHFTHVNDASTKRI
jgi:hypothetical protein